MSHTPEQAKLSAIEMAKAVAALQGFADTRRDFEALKAAFVPTAHLPRVNQILDGLAQEDEFAIFCKIMGTCEAISRIDQTPIIESREKAADFLVSFRPDVSTAGLRRDDVGVTISCLVEVKSCSKPRFTITAKDLGARMKYAARFGLPLIVAVRFTIFGRNTLWVLMEANALERRGRKIHCTDLIQSLTPVLFDDYGLFTHPSLHLIHYYDSTPGLSGIRHKDYGTQTKTTVVVPDHAPIDIPDDISPFVNVFFESFEHKIVQVERHEHLSVVVSHVGNQMRILSDLVYSANYLARDEGGDVAYDAGRTIARLDSGTKPLLITRSMIEHVTAYLNRHKIMLFMMGLGKPDHQEKTLRELAR
jgi:hypothetical protein